LANERAMDGHGWETNETILDLELEEEISNWSIEQVLFGIHVICQVEAAIKRNAAVWEGALPEILFKRIDLPQHGMLILLVKQTPQKKTVQVTSQSCQQLTAMMRIWMGGD
jgi:hypothetical protein